MRKRLSIVFLLLLSTITLSSCNSFSKVSGREKKKEINSSIYYSTKKLNKFGLEEVEENDVNKIPLKENVYYKITDNKQKVTFYVDDLQEEKKVDGKILNDKIVFYNDSYLSIVYNEKYNVYDFTNDKYINLDFDLIDFDNMHLYVVSQYLYLIGSKDDTTKIFMLSENYEKEEVFNTRINTVDGVAFLYLWDNYFVIQNVKYEYYTNCDSNLTKLEMNNQFDVINNEIFSGLKFNDGEWDSTSYFFKHNLFYSNESSEKDYYDRNKNSQCEDQYTYYSNFCDNNIHIDYSGRIDNCYQFYYNHIYYFLMTNWYLPYGESRQRGYYFIRFDSLNSVFQISDLNMSDTVKEFKQSGNQIALNVSLECDGKFVDKNYIFYIK